MMRLAQTARARRFAVLAAIGLAGVLALLWLLGRTLDQGRTTASDSELVADLQVARATLQTDVATAARRAAVLAHSRRVETALARGNAAELEALAAAHPDTLLISSAGVQGGSLAPVGVRRAVEVSSGGQTIGRVVTEAALDAPFLARARASLPSGSDDLLVLTERGLVKAGALPSGSALSAVSVRDVRVNGHTYRALGSLLTSDRPELAVVALSPRSSRFLSAWRLPLAVLVSLVALGALVLLFLYFSRERARPRRAVVVPKREEPAETRAPVSIEALGDELAAASDVEALLRVVLDAAIKATGAAGGRIAHPGEPLSRGGETGREVLRVPVETDDPGGGSALLLYPPPSGFSAQAAEVAHWLGAHASMAMRDAHSHRVAPDEGAVDELTGLANRRQFTTMLQRKLARAERTNEVLAVLLSDLDDLNALRGRSGTRVRDELLKLYAAVIRGCLREIDFAARIGVETFGLLLPETDADGARQVAERLRSTLHSVEGLPEPPTASFGISSYPQATTAEALLLGADDSLRRARSAGGDQIVG